MPLILLPLLACDPATEHACEDAAETDGSLTIGTGEMEFGAVDDGDAVQMVYGSQGGLMIYGALRADGIVQPLLADPDTDPLVDFQVMTETGPIGGYTAFARHFDADDGALTLVGERLILDVYDSAALDGAEVTLTATLVDACGRALSAERTVTLRE